MSLLGDLLEAAAGSLLGGFGPSTDRGQLVLWSVVGLVLSAANGWLFLTSANPLNEPDWGLGAVAFGIVFGAGGVMLTALHLARWDDDRALTLAALVTNVAAVVIAFLCVL